MNNKYKIVLPILAVILLAAGCTKSTTETTTESTQSTNTNTTESADVKTFSMDQVKQANLETNCWAVVSGGVYNLTDWIAKHPGGSKAIISLCGTDGTDAFISKHGSSDKAKAALASFKIGDLIQ